MIAPLVQHLVLAALPSGGQRAARRNAWAALVADKARSRAAREADAAMAAALATSSRRTG